MLSIKLCYILNNGKLITRKMYQSSQPNSGPGIIKHCQLKQHIQDVISYIRTYNGHYCKRAYVQMKKHPPLPSTNKHASILNAQMCLILTFMFFTHCKPCSPASKSVIDGGDWMMGSMCLQASWLLVLSTQAVRCSMLFWIARICVSTLIHLQMT